MYYKLTLEFAIDADDRMAAQTVADKVEHEILEFTLQRLPEEVAEVRHHRVEMVAASRMPCSDYAPDTLAPDAEDRDICTTCFYRGEEHTR